jgi:hypothetical protein
MTPDFNSTPMLSSLLHTENLRSSYILYIHYILYKKNWSTGPKTRPGPVHFGPGPPVRRFALYILLVVRSGPGPDSRSRSQTLHTVYLGAHGTVRTYCGPPTGVPVYFRYSSRVLQYRPQVYRTARAEPENNAHGNLA